MPVDSLLSCAGGGGMTSVRCSFIVCSLAFAAAILPATGAESLTIADSFLPGDSYRMSSASVVGFATEFEWERAAQGPEQRPFPYGERLDLSRIHTDPRRLEAVGSYPAGASSEGVLDLTGNNVCILAPCACHRFCGGEFFCPNAHRDAGVAVMAGWAVSYVLAAPETHLPKRFVQGIRIRRCEVGENLTLFQSLDIGAGRRCCHEEARKAC